MVIMEEEEEEPQELPSFLHAVFFFLPFLTEFILYLFFINRILIN